MILKSFGPRLKQVKSSHRLCQDTAVLHAVSGEGNEEKRNIFVPV